MLGTFAPNPAARVAMRWLAILANPVCWLAELNAADISWINGNGGTFSTVSNWSDLPNLPDRAPGPNDTARFGLTSPAPPQRAYTVSFTSNPTNQALVVEDDRVTFDLNGHVYIVTRTSGPAIELGLSSTYAGALTITDGTVALSNNSRVQVGSSAFANGLITVGSGGLLAGSLADLFIGSGTASGTLTIENNGDVIADEVHLAAVPGTGRGRVNVTGGGSTLLANAITVGEGGSGTLDVANGGIVETASSILGHANTGSRGTVLVHGAGSRWKAGDLTVGRLGDGELQVTGGGFVTCTEAVLSSSQNFSAAPGTVTVGFGDATFEVNGRLDVAFSQPGSKAMLHILQDGIVRVTQDTQVGVRGFIQLDGGVFQTSAIMFQDSEDSISNFQWASGTLHVGTFLGDLINGNGVLAPGASAGTTTINGDYQHLAAATLQIEIGGTVPGTQYDLVNVTGDVLLAGSLQLDLLNGFIPAATDVFTILGTMGSFTGSFANVANGQRLAASNGAGSFVVTYTQNKILLSGYQLGVLGDYNQNGAVDAADYAVWRKNLGSAVSLPNDDTPGVGQDDYARWRFHFGLTAGSGAALLSAASPTATVPEVETIALLIWAAATIGCGGHRTSVRVSKLI